MLYGLAQEGSGQTQAMRARQEHLDWFKKYERAIKTLVPEDQQFLVNLLKAKLERVCRSKA